MCPVESTIFDIFLKLNLPLMIFCSLGSNLTKNIPSLEIYCCLILLGYPDYNLKNSFCLFEAHMLYLISMPNFETQMNHWTFQLKQENESFSHSLSKKLEEAVDWKGW